MLHFVGTYLYVPTFCNCLILSYTSGDNGDSQPLLSYLNSNESGLWGESAIFLFCPTLSLKSGRNGDSQLFMQEMSPKEINN